MRKSVKNVLFAVLILVIAVSLCACGKDETTAEDSGLQNQTPILYGRYDLYAIDYEDGQIVLANDLFKGQNYVDLKGSRDAEICIEDKVRQVKWTRNEGAKVTFMTDGGDMNGSVENGVLTLDAGDGNMYFVAYTSAKDRINAVSLDELPAVDGSDVSAVSDVPSMPVASYGPKPSEIPEGRPVPVPTEKPVPEGATSEQLAWNGWYFGCVDVDGCSKNYEKFNGKTYDAVMYIEINKAGKGALKIYDPFGAFIENEDHNVLVEAECYVDGDYLKAHSGTAFGCEMHDADWRFVHNAEIPEKLTVSSSSITDDGDRLGYAFQFKHWGDRWTDDNYTQFIPQFQAYLNALDAGLDCPFSDFQGLGIAEYLGGGEVNVPVERPALPVDNITITFLGSALTEFTQRIGTDPIQLKADIDPAEAATMNRVMWRSSNESIITVSDTGLVTAVGPGWAEVIVECGGVTESCKVWVPNP